MDTPYQPTHISLCSGYGGIDLGLRRVIPSLRTIALSEIEAFACANLVAKMEAGLLDPAPIWTDLRTFPWGRFRGRVDILSGGFPCQPFSAAGKRAGDEDPRHLFPHILRGITECQPRVVFLENVEGIISAKLTGGGWRDPAGTSVLLHVLRELERVGYRATAGVFSSAEIGASHQRKRVFILAVADSQYSQSDQRESQDGSRDERSLTRRSEHGTGGESISMADAPDDGHDAAERPSRARPSTNQRRLLQSARMGPSPRDVRLCRPLPPGPEQWWWEPSRVIDNECQTVANPSRLQPSEQQSTGDQSVGCRGEASTISQNPLANSPRDGRGEGRSEPIGQQGRPDATECGEPTMGDATKQCNRLHENTRQERDQRWGDTESTSQQGLGTPPEPRLEGTTGESLCGDCGGFAYNDREQGNDTRRQTQPPLGGDTDGSASGLDYAQLCSTVDSRVDELRLLGNGVDPDVAAKAFVVLYNRLTQSSPFPDVQSS